MSDHDIAASSENIQVSFPWSIAILPVQSTISNHSKILIIVHARDANFRSTKAFSYFTKNYPNFFFSHQPVTLSIRYLLKRLAVFRWNYRTGAFFIYPKRSISPSSVNSSIIKNKKELHVEVPLSKTDPSHHHFYICHQRRWFLSAQCISTCDA